MIWHSRGYHPSVSSIPNFTMIYLFLCHQIGSEIISDIKVFSLIVSCVHSLSPPSFFVGLHSSDFCFLVSVSHFSGNLFLGDASFCLCVYIFDKSATSMFFSHELTLMSISVFASSLIELHTKHQFLSLISCRACTVFYFLHSLEINCLYIFPLCACILSLIIEMVL